MAESLVPELLKNGLLGLIVCALSLLLIHLWRELREEHRSRLSEAKETTAQLLKVHDKVGETVEKLHDLGEIFREQSHTISRMSRPE